ncbi:uncharacterized protein LOC131638159 [Vicia villosa]|uniref:uncharacterized protein LOC131638159 n=1 Tax=Vicia villosa TaxID=3911 RepID=UPI00273C705B|nr:uncharacterized protein LOC131638159 [Vicia villosa]
MSRPVERIAEINNGKELWKIVVRIHHRWNVVANNKEHFEMIFVDKLGDDIHAVVPAPHVSVFTEKCLLGHTYTVSNFKVVPYVLAFKASEQKYMTESGAKKQQISMVLRDHSNNMLNCTLWESYADQFIRFNKVRVAASLPTIVLLQYAKVKEEGKYPLSVTNTYNVTLLCVDADFPVMKDFIDRMPEESRITFCATVATTKLLVASPFGWYYRACHMCQSIACGDNPPFECEAGHETMAEVLRYKIEIEDTHGGKSCNLCSGTENVKCSWVYLRLNFAEITDPLDFPLEVDQLLKLEMAMKVKWHPRWKNCSVIMIIKNDHIMQQLKEKWGTDEEPIPIQTVIPETLEIKESVDEAKTDVNEDCELVTDLEITSEHKPDAVTPAGKRHFPGVSSESTDLDGLYDEKLSSNKLKKIIKMEKID